MKYDQKEMINQITIALNHPSMIYSPNFTAAAKLLGYKDYRGLWKYLKDNQLNIVCSQPAEFKIVKTQNL